MGQKSGPAKEPAEQVIRGIRRSTRRQFSAEEKIRIVLSGLRGEDSIAELCRREGIVPSSTAAAAAPLSSPPLSSRPFPQNHPRLHPLRRQIPIAGQAVTTFPRVPSSEAFGRRPLVLGRPLRPGPASETLHGSGLSRYRLG